MLDPAPATPATPDRAYAEVRREFVEGDVLLFRGRGLVSKAIRVMTRSRYSHAGLAYRFGDRVYCLEAVGSGVRLCLMSELVRHYDGGIDCFDAQGATPEQRHGAIGFGFEQLGKPFDHAGIVRFFLLLAFGRRPRARVDGHWFCAELVAEAYRRQGLRLAEGSAAYTSPNALATSPLVRFRYRLKR